MRLRRAFATSCFTGALALSLSAGGPACSSSSGPPPVPKKDAGADTSSPVDTGSPLDVLGESMKLKACMPPTSLPGFTAVIHKRPSQLVCTPEIFDQLMTACLNPATQTAADCTAALSAFPGSMNCFYQCMTTQFLPSNAGVASDAWGGIVQRQDQPGLFFFNYGGCVAALDPSAEGQRCAKDGEGLLECQAQSCSTCTVPSSPSSAQVTAYDDCEMSSPCSSYTTMGESDCASNYPGMGPASGCLQAEITIESPTSTAAEAGAAIRFVIGAICAPAALTMPDGGPDALGD
jgi:hypothetical protein